MRLVAADKVGLILERLLFAPRYRKLNIVEKCERPEARSYVTSLEYHYTSRESDNIRYPSSGDVLFRSFGLMHWQKWTR